MINSQNLINALDEYEMKLCQKYPNCRDCPCNAEDLAYGSDKCGIELVQNGIRDIAKEK